MQQQQMTEDFELGNKQESSPGSDSESKEPSALDSISYSARVASSMLGNVACCTWPQDSILQAQRRNSLFSVGDDIMSFPDPRRDSLGLGGDLGSFAAGSRRNSLALGLDLNLGDQQLSSDVAALASQSLGSQSLMNSSLGSAANAQLQQLQARHVGDISAQQQQLLLQQHQQQQRQQQAMSSMVERSTEAKRVQAEAQAAAAALFFGAPIPGNGNEDNAANSLDHQLGRSDNFSGSGSRQRVGSAGLSALPAPNAFQNSQQLLRQRASSSTSRDMLGMGLNLGGTSGSGNVSLDNSLQPLNSFSQLQQLQLQQKQLQQNQQQQQQLHLLQSSFGASSSQTPQQQQQKQLQQLQLQQQLRQQEMGRHSLGLSLPFDTVANSQQQQHQQLKLKEQSLTEQLRLHQQQLESLSGKTDLLGAKGGGTKRGQLSSPPLSNKKPNFMDSKQSSTGSDLQSPTKGAASKKDNASFPLKLHEILCNPEYSEMIAWMPHGKSWRIMKPSAFENIVIPSHFRHSKYASFMRQVNGWGFQRVLHGNDHNSYKHDLFVREQPELCKKMKRVGTVKKIKDNAAADAAESGSQDRSAGDGGSSRKQKVSKEASLDSGNAPALPSLSKLSSIINSNLSDPPSPHHCDATLRDFGGNDVNSISAARSALSNKFAASIGNIGRGSNVAPNQASNSFGEMFQDASSLEVAGNSSLGLGHLGSRQMQNLMKLNPASLLSGKLPQQQQGLAPFAAPGEGLDCLQQQLALGATTGFNQQQQSISSLSKGGSLSGLPGGSASLQGLGGQQQQQQQQQLQQGSDSDPFSSPQFQGGAPGGLNGNQNVEI